jgi:hypothetical protein
MAILRTMLRRLNMQRRLMRHTSLYLNCMRRERFPLNRVNLGLGLVSHVGQLEVITKNIALSTHIEIRAFDLAFRIQASLRYS